MNSLLWPLLRLSGRSWWEAHFFGGKTTGEWKTCSEGLLLPSQSGRSSRWETVDKTNMVGLSLLCPDGQEVTLQGKPGHFFQLKHGVRMVTGQREQLAHLIGVVTDDDGNADCAAWEPAHFVQREGLEVLVPGRLLTFRDNYRDLKYQQIGAIAREPQQLVV